MKMQTLRGQVEKCSSQVISMFFFEAVRPWVGDRQWYHWGGNPWVDIEGRSEELDRLARGGLYANGLEIYYRYLSTKK
jgi:hypothetical protein